MATASDEWDKRALLMEKDYGMPKKLSEKQCVTVTDHGIMEYNFEENAWNEILQFSKKFINYIPHKFVINIRTKMVYVVREI